MTIDELILWLGVRFSALTYGPEKLADHPWAVTFIHKEKAIKSPGFKTPIEALEYAISFLIENDPKFEKGEG